MIFVSSACSSKKIITQAIEELYSQGFTNIELSGGTRYYENLHRDLIELKKTYDLNFLLHNYFPPPRKDFVLNLASLNYLISRKSIEFCKKSIDISRDLDATKVSFHAGFMIDFPASQIGKNIHAIKRYDRDLSFTQLINNCNILLDYAKDDLDIYLENNVYSRTNAQNFGMICPFFLTNYEDFMEIHNSSSVNLLLDVAHLKVSSNTLGYSFENQLGKMLKISDYIHISENNGVQDENRPLFPGCSILTSLSPYDFSGKTCSLEIYDSMKKLRTSYDLAQKTLYNVLYKE